VDSRRGVTFADLAQHYAEHELAEHTESIHPKAHTTIRAYERVLRNRLLPRWGNSIALGIEPLEVEQWLKDLKREKRLANPTVGSGNSEPLIPEILSRSAVEGEASSKFR
jgi:hypothetical protein